MAKQRQVGLFATPEQVRLAEQNQALALGVGGAAFNAGRGVNRTIRSQTGEDLRSPAVKRAEIVQTAMRGANFSDQNDILGRVRDLENLGLFNEANVLRQNAPLSKLQTKEFTDADGNNITVLGQTDGNGMFRRVDGSQTPNFKPSAPPDTYSKPLTKRISLNGKTKLVYGYNQYTNGDTTSTPKFVKSFEISSNPSTAKPNDLVLPPGLLKDVKVDDTTAGGVVSRVAALPRFKGTFKNTDPDKVALFTKRVQAAMQVISQKERDNIRNGYITSFFDAQKAGKPLRGKDFQFVDFKKDSVLMNDVFNQMVEGGVFDKLIQSTFYAGDDPNIAPFTDITDLPTLQQNIADNRTRHTASDAAGKRFESRVAPGNPRENEFRRAGETLSDFAKVIGSGASDDQIARVLQDRFPGIANQDLSTHQIRWQAMRENPEAVNVFLRGDPNLTFENGSTIPVGKGSLRSQRQSAQARYLTNLAVSGEWQKWFAATEVFKYLGGFAGPQQFNNQQAKELGGNNPRARGGS